MSAGGCPQPHEQGTETMIKSIKTLLVSGVMAATAVAATGASAAQLITYGGFETITAFSPYWKDQSTANDAIVASFDGKRAIFG